MRHIVLLSWWFADNHHGPSMDHPWTHHGLLTDRAWIHCGPRWTVHRPAKDPPWTVDGLFIDFSWAVHGPVMDPPWTTMSHHGLCIDHHGPRWTVHGTHHGLSIVFMDCPSTVHVQTINGPGLYMGPTWSVHGPPWTTTMDSMYSYKLTSRLPRRHLNHHRLSYIFLHWNKKKEMLQKKNILYWIRTWDAKATGTAPCRVKLAHDMYLIRGSVGA